VTDTSKTQPADSFREEFGSEPELKRTLGSFQVFAISFAFISVAVGIFGTYDNVLENAGRGYGSGSSWRSGNSWWRW
jgi:amino acid transporter